MPPEDLNKKRELARQAMSGKKKSESTTTLPQNNENKESQFTNPLTKDLTKLRKEAQKAMEGQARHQERQSAERKIVEEKIRAEKIEEIKKQRERLEVKQKEEEQLRAKDERTEELNKKISYEKSLKESEEKIGEISKKSTPISSLHTISSDLSNRNISTAGHDSQKIIYRTTEPEKRKLSKNTLLSILTIILSLSFLGGGFWVLSASGIKIFNRQQGVDLKEVSSIVPTAGHAKILITGKAPLEITNSIKTNLRPGANPALLNIYFVKEELDEDENLTEERLTFSDFQAVMNFDLPSSFTHFLEPDFMLGAWSESNSATELTYVFKTRSFEHTFDSLLNDENKIIETLYSSFISAEKITDLNIKSFVDKSTNNIDSRALLNGEDEIIFIYTFIDQNILIVAESEEALLFTRGAYQTK